MTRRKRHSSRGAGRGYDRSAADRRTRTPYGTPSPKPGSPHAAGSRPRRRAADYAAYEKEEATPDYMQRLFHKHDFTVADEELERFWRYYCLLREENKGLHLTRIIGIEATVLKHFVDCAIVADMLEINGPLLDIGSGPGFPGVPIAIRKPGLAVILAESRGARVRFLERIKQELAIDNIRLFTRSVRCDSPFVPASETATAMPSTHTETTDSRTGIPVNSVISRALEAIPLTLERVRDFMPADGRVIFMKGPNCGQEVTQAQERFKGVYKMVDDIRYTLPHTRQNRRLVVFARR